MFSGAAIVNTAISDTVASSASTALVVKRTGYLISIPPHETGCFNHTLNTPLDGDPEHRFQIDEW
jgi:inorganic pyrophosphatase